MRRGFARSTAGGAESSRHSGSRTRREGPISKTSTPSLGSTTKSHPLSKAERFRYSSLDPDDWQEATGHGGSSHRPEGEPGRFDRGRGRIQGGSPRPEEQFYPCIHPGTTILTQGANGFNKSLQQYSTNRMNDLAKKLELANETKLQKTQAALSELK